MAELKRYFPTVDWCSEGRRGIFCNRQGKTFASDTPHTLEQLHAGVGPFFLILAPKSEAFTVDEVKQFTHWTPLDEFSGQWGIARREA